MPALATDKYPPNIVKLFAPRPPLLYVPPVDYPPEERKTRVITPVSYWKSACEEHAKHIRDTVASQEPSEPTLMEKQAKLRAEKEQAQSQSFHRQMEDWNNPEVMEKLEKEVMKDPYCTLFVARLDYEVTEMEISHSFGKYGAISSIRIIRDNEGKSRGYGFVVFEREVDAAACLRELAPTGIKILPKNGSSKPRTALVDMEQSRIARNWKPRRLGGGLGGRGYTRASQYHLAVASSAASGRRQPNKFRRDNPQSTNQHPHSTRQYPQSRPSNPTSYGAPQMAYGLTVSYGQPRDSGPEMSVRDKYSKYGTPATPSYRLASSLRSVRNIRRE